MLRDLRLQTSVSIAGSGALTMLLSVLFYVAGDLLIKGRLNGLPSNEVVFFRNLFGLAFLLTVPSDRPLVIVGKRFWLLISRGMLGFLSLSLFYYLLMHAPLANAVVFLQSSTIFSALIVFVVVRERLTVLQATATVVGFAGICVIVKPHIGITVYDLLGIVLGIVSALANTSIKELKECYDSRSIVFSYLVVGILFPLLFSLAGGAIPISSLSFLTTPFVWPSAGTIAVLAGVAVLTTLGQIYKTRAYALDKAGIIGTIGYSRIAFAIAAGILMGDGGAGIGTLIGIALVTIAAIMVSYKNKGL